VVWADLPIGRFGLTHRPIWVITQILIIAGWIPRIRVVSGCFSGKSGSITTANQKAIFAWSV
jgi:hypothetical protein